jgi:uncharacterized protein (UPF0262 family)
MRNVRELTGCGPEGPWAVPVQPVQSKKVEHVAMERHESIRRQILLLLPRRVLIGLLCCSSSFSRFF